MNDRNKNILRNLVWTALIGVWIVGLSYNYKRNEEYLIKERESNITRDLNNDGREDFAHVSKDGLSDVYFIQREDGRYDKCRLIGRDGIGFFETFDKKFSYDVRGAVIDNLMPSNSHVMSKIDVRQITNTIPAKKIEKTSQ